MRDSVFLLMNELPKIKMGKRYLLSSVNFREPQINECTDELGLSPYNSLIVLALEIRAKISSEGLILQKTNDILKETMNHYYNGISLDSFSLDFYENLKTILNKELNQYSNLSNKDLIDRLISQVNKIIL